MEFKDNLKQLRTKQGLTQAQLAEKLFVSRSTVAKWENGLGFPHPDMMAQLEQLFGIGAQDLATKEPEIVITEKNRKLRLIGQILGWGAVIAVLILMSVLPFALRDGTYGFTTEMAAGVYADEPYIDTGDYRIYYFTFEGAWEDGRHWSDLQGWRPVQKHIWGCTVDYEKAEMHVITKNHYVVGQLYTIKGKHGYYHLLNKAGHYKADEQGGMVWDIPEELITAESVTIGREEYPLQDGFFFVTQKPVEYFEIGDAWYDVIG